MRICPSSAGRKQLRSTQELEALDIWGLEAGAVSMEPWLYKPEGRQREKGKQKEKKSGRVVRKGKV